ncbi:MAG: hypothetical protein JEZ08_00945 [Clostridiales bacterium]|nr:hypothetical protein [Clostridiales bacterium]
MKLSLRFFPVSRLSVNLIAEVFKLQTGPNAGCDRTSELKANRSEIGIS